MQRTSGREKRILVRLDSSAYVSCCSACRRCNVFFAAALSVLALDQSLSKRASCSLRSAVSLSRTAFCACRPAKDALWSARTCRHTTCSPSCSQCAVSCHDQCMVPQVALSSHRHRPSFHSSTLLCQSVATANMLHLFGLVNK